VTGPWCACVGSLLPVRVLVLLHNVAMHDNISVDITQKYTPGRKGAPEIGETAITIERRSTWHSDGPIRSYVGNRFLGIKFLSCVSHSDEESLAISVC
jgi:hypothetical protein